MEGNRAMLLNRSMGRELLERHHVKRWQQQRWACQFTGGNKASNGECCTMQCFSLFVTCGYHQQRALQAPRRQSEIERFCRGIQPGYAYRFRSNIAGRRAFERTDSLREWRFRGQCDEDLCKSIFRQTLAT